MPNIKNCFINLTDPSIFETFGGEKYWQRVETPAGQAVVQEGEASQDFYYIVSGRVNVTKAMSGGAQKHLATLAQGDFFGEGSLLSDEARGASVIAAQDTVLYRLTKDSFNALVVADAQAAVGIILGIVKVLNARMQHSNSRLIALYNVAQFIRQYAGNGPQIIQAILAELVQRMGTTSIALYGMDGLLQFAAEGADPKKLEYFQMLIPDYANRLNEAGAPQSLSNEDTVFCAVRNLQGQLVAVLTAASDEASVADDSRLYVTVAEQIGHLY